MYSYIFSILFILATNLFLLKQLGPNIRILRKQKGWTQAQLAEKLNVNRSLIGAYEDARSEPRLDTLQLFCHLFGVSLEALLYKKLDQKSPSPIRSDYPLRILPVAVEPSGRELISLIPQKAAAGYTQGYADTEYIEGLKSISLPLPELQQSGTLRIFQIEGDSMLPVQPGSYIIGEFEENWETLKNNACYILLTLNDGIVYKRIENELSSKNRLLLKSDNTEYKPYYLDALEILEVWRAKGILSFQVPGEKDLQDMHYQKMIQGIDELKAELKELKSQVKK